MRTSFFYTCAAVVAVVACASSLSAQASRITGPVKNNERTTLAGNVHPKAIPANDQGRVSPSLEMPYITLVLSRSASQQAALEKLLAAQQTPGSPYYHQWLTPEQFGAQFGASDSDINTITQWLQQQGLKLVSVGRARSSIVVSGTAAQVEPAFQTQIHTYLVNGETHYANASAPTIPAAFGSVIMGIRGLTDFHLKPRLRPSAIKPTYTDSSCGNNCVAPDDFATIYDVAPLYNAGLNGTGQKIAVAGQIEVNMSDIEQFRSMFGLPPNVPQPVLVPGSRSPGSSSSSGDLAESDLDLEWSGAVARDATIIFVYSTDVMTSAQYAIDQNLAPVLSISYGACEQETGQADANEYRSWAQQANAQGITWSAASGDNGAADCDDTQNPGLAVDLPGSIPEVTSVGGTQFNEGTGTYWNNSNTATDESALSYIPEQTWNTSAIDGSPSASGGGASTMFAKPSWQTGTGVPADNARDVPDVALNASDDHDPYLVYTSGSLQAYGGTSVGAPTFSGLIALLNEQLAANGQGNVNPKLYSLAQAGWGSGMFHDSTVGNNMVTVPCGRRQSICDNPQVGYYAGVGYDQTTGLGSVDAYKLIMGWNGVTVTTPTTPTTPTITANMSLLSNVSTVISGDVVYLTATVTSTNGTTPTGSVSFSYGSATGTAALTGSAGTATATLVLNALPEGSTTVTASYNGANPASLTINVTGPSSRSSAGPAVTSVSNGASFKQAFAPGAVLSIFGTNLATVTQQASSVPLPITVSGLEVLIDGVAAPLYYVSPSQLNVQIPYETTVGGTAQVSINNNGQVTSAEFQVAAAAPGIFTNTSGALVPTSSAAIGQEIELYVTGTGAVQPAISDGAAPSSSTAVADLPAPSQTTIVTIGGARASIDFLGIPAGLVGVTQINVTIPSGIAAGTQPVVVTVGGIPSAPATITITN